MSLAVQQAYARSAQILTTLQAGNGGSLVTLYQPSVVTPWDITASLRFNGYISDLRCRIDINSLDETNIPDLGLQSNRTQRITAVRDQEWNAPRYELEVLMQSTYSGGWHSLFTVSLLNRLPYYIIDLLGYFSNQVAFAVAADAILGVRIVDAGYGFLKGDDRVTIFGAAKEEALALPTESPEIVSTSDATVTVQDVSAVVLPANPARKLATLTNASTNRILYLTYNSTAQVGKGFCLYPNGGTLNIDTANLYRGAITAIADGPNAPLSVAEAV